MPKAKTKTKSKPVWKELDIEKTPTRKVKKVFTTVSVQDHVEAIRFQLETLLFIVRTTNITEDAKIEKLIYLAEGMNGLSEAFYEAFDVEPEICFRIRVDK